MVKDDSSGGVKDAQSEEKDDQSAAQRIAEEHKAESGETGTEEAALVEGVQKTSISNGHAEPPAVVTKPGEPVGDVVFDHPPSEGEVKEALKAAA